MASPTPQKKKRWSLGRLIKKGMGATSSSSSSSSSGGGGGGGGSATKQQQKQQKAMLSALLAADEVCRHICASRISARTRVRNHRPIVATSMVSTSHPFFTGRCIRLGQVHRLVYHRGQGRKLSSVRDAPIASDRRGRKHPDALCGA
jgi:hypothetical protein